MSSEKLWTVLDVVATAVGIVGGLTSVWRDLADARQMRVRAELDALDLRTRADRGQPVPDETDRKPTWIEL